MPRPFPLAAEVPRDYANKIKLIMYKSSLHVPYSRRAEPWTPRENSELVDISILHSRW